MDTQTIIPLVQQKIGVTDDGIAGPVTWKALYKNIFNEDEGTKDLLSVIRAVQKQVGTTPDGVPGTHTWQAIHKFLFTTTIAAQQEEAAIDTSNVDDRSEKCIASLVPEIQDTARALVHKAAEAGITIKIICGLRTYEEQDELFAQGRTKTGKKVTNARGGFSNHNFGLAFDVGIFEDDEYIEESPDYKTVGQMGKSLGLAWGGDWESIQDEPHFELRPIWAKNLSERDMLTELRKRKDGGESFLA
jgi:peptidoglycan L-alanyl-D-glutamate endopeptidase CwlK